MAADAALAAVTHGTTSYAMPAAFSASAFSAPRAQTPGSPHFKRTTRFSLLGRCNDHTRNFVLWPVMATRRFTYVNTLGVATCEREDIKVNKTVIVDNIDLS